MVAPCFIREKVCPFDEPMPFCKKLNSNVLLAASEPSQELTEGGGVLVNFGLRNTRASRGKASRRMTNLI